MPQRSALVRVARLAPGACLLLLTSCQGPGATRIVGPDGSPMAHVHCGSDQGTCFRIAGELCPTGYEIKPVLSGNDGNFLVRCRAKATPGTAPATDWASASSSPPPRSAAPAAPALASTPAQAQAWPPAAEPWPPTNPWPAAQTSAQPVPSAQPASSSDVDIGY